MTGLKRNVGMADRVVRHTIGVLFLGIAIFQLFSPLWNIVFFFLGLSQLFTAITGYCPVYDLLNITTIRDRLERI